MPKYQHAVLLGCTGMLKRASVAIASRSVRMTSVAGTTRSLDSLDRELAHTGVRHVMIALDWSAQDEYVDRVVDYIRGTVAPDLVIAWIHDDTLALRLVVSLCAEQSDLDFFHVISSATNDPGRVATRIRGQLPTPCLLRYYQVVLAAKREAGRTRWLTHSEISTGVLEATCRRVPTLVVGDICVSLATFG